MRKISLKRCFLAGAAVILTAAMLITGGIMIFSNRSRAVGKDVSAGDVTDFYWTVSTSTFPPHFQRYRFTAEEGKCLFYHEKREGDHFPLMESDITESGTLELAAEQWEEFFRLLSGGTVVNRSEDRTDGDSGPWTYLYWKGDRGKCQEFSFESNEKQMQFEEFCEELKQQQMTASG